MDEVRLQELFMKIADGDQEERQKAATEIINSADDAVLRGEITNFAMTMQQAKDSVEQDKVINALNLYFKKQMAAVFCQSFAYGQKYQHAVDLIIIPQQLQQQAQKLVEELNEKDEELKGKLEENKEEGNKND